MTDHRFLFARSRVQRRVVCSAEGVKTFVKNASQQAAVLAASALIAGVRILYIFCLFLGERLGDWIPCVDVGKG